MPDGSPKPEFSRVKTVAELSARLRNMRFDTTASEREALTERFGLVSLEAFSVIWSTRSWRRNGVKLSGRVIADYVQSCVVTLEPLPVHLDEAFEINCLPEDSIERLEENGELILAFDDQDGPEPIVDGRIDLGELASQYLATAIDPYPKSAAARANLNARSPANGVSDENRAEAGSERKPFAVLEQLKKR